MSQISYSTSSSGLKEIFAALTKKPMFIALLMGFSSGLPLLLASKTMQTWLAFTGTQAKEIGLFALVSLPYALKFLWAPFMDRYTLNKLGRRRGWILITQLGILVFLVSIATIQPSEQLFLASLFSLGVSFFGASQDIAVDAYRRETLKDEELGLGSAVYNLGYRTAMWLSSGLAIILAGVISWNAIYFIMGGVMLITIGFTLWADEPEVATGAPKTLLDAVVLPLKDFFTRRGAILFLIFILLYKVGDSMAGNMLNKFYVDLGYSEIEIGTIAKTMGIFSVVVGTFVGGIIIVKLGIYRALFIFGVLQALSTLSFLILNLAGHDLPIFAGVIFFEDFTSGMGSAAFMAFMASLTNKNFTATQYALLTSLMAVPRTVISSITGYIVDFMGWVGFFTSCAVIALPGLALIYYVRKIDKLNEAPTT